jgi:hypothetical protein
MSPSPRRQKARKVKGEGWDVFEITGSIHVPDGALCIQRIDDPAMVLPESRLRAGPLLPEPAFDSDDEAILHVIAEAQAGKRDALRALWLVLPDDEWTNRVMWCLAMGWKV